MSFMQFDYPTPRLHPKHNNWCEDLPENHEPQLVPPQLRWLTERNDIYLEVPRYRTEVMWGGMLLSAFLSLACAVLSLILAFVMTAGLKWYDLYGILIWLWAGGFFPPLILYCLKMYFVEPRSQPIRLNRKRQKLYVYNYKQPWQPWRKAITRISVYHWADIHGEVHFESTPAISGYHLYGALCEPGTHQVVERFVLAKEWGEREQLNQIWSYLCMYMQHDDELPPPRNAGTADFWQPRKADAWPEAMERESTSTP
ncbi:DUF6708 domain-containing protein [Mangrovibacter plantisponsor]|uniref:DUF6708 domain-containing protein n=1 Tax=Mangrovibacter plantisponsor TaxID=451513 RepID=A0A317PKX4_9ENTR|nr:DUF6708 domain-containing protein [Mangrovibacter plantisponsor]PWV98590.1 hypothetical protein DES37_1392 [Mangrovibacter plantisponsor]